MTKAGHKVSQCLEDIGLVGDNENVAALKDCESLEQEFSLLKKTYHKTILICHPDKGGDAATFRKTRAAFEVLRRLYQKGAVKDGTFTFYLADDDVAEEYDTVVDSVNHAEVPSYDFYAEAAAEDVPKYRVELAKSGRSKCQKCKDGPPKKPKPKKKGKQAAESVTEHAISLATVDALPFQETIPKGVLRVGSLDKKGGNYGRWYHLSCWRVPSRLWSGLTNPDDPDAVLQDLISMDEVLLSGVTELDEHPELQALFVQHVANKEHWAKKYNRTSDTEKKDNNNRKPKASTKRKSAANEKSNETDREGNNPKRAKTGSEENSTGKPTGNEKKESESEGKRDKTGDEENSTNNESSKEITKAKQKFVIPRPGKNGAVAEGFLDAKRFVLTGVFPELGGGTGLTLGKGRMKAMIESFGGRVTGSVSGKTDFLVVGKEPGRSKVKEAKNRGVPMIDSRSLQKMLFGELTLEAAEEQPPPRIEGFSSGYGNRRIENY